MLGTFDYIFFGVFALLLFFSYFIGIEKMVRLILGNYIFIPVSLALRNLFDFIPIRIDQYNIDIFKNQAQFQNFILNNKIAIIFVIYFLFVLFIIFKSNLGIGYIHGKGKRFFYSLILGPFVVLIVILCLGTIILGSEVFTSSKLIEFTSQFQSVYLQNVANFLPLYFLLPGFVLLILSSSFKLPKINLRHKKNPPVDPNQAE